jgi:hypothetical protein
MPCRRQRVRRLRVERRRHVLAGERVVEHRLRVGALVASAHEEGLAAPGAAHLEAIGELRAGLLQPQPRTAGRAADDDAGHRARGAGHRPPPWRESALMGASAL